MITFEKAFKYPFNRPKGLLNALWLLLPIFGWFAYGGYVVRIIKEFLAGKFNKTPEFSFESDMKKGFWIFLKALPFFIAFLLVTSILGYVHFGLSFIFELFFGIFVIPILFINLINKESVEATFEFNKINVVFDNLSEYIVVILKSFALGIIFLALSIVLVGIPAGSYTKNIFIADFYRKYCK